MQKRNLGKQIWDILSPLLLYILIASVVEFVIFLIYYAQQIPALASSIQTMDEFTEVYYGLLEEVLQYSTEITALSALITLPFLVLMTRKDRKREIAEGIVPNRKAPLFQYLYVAGICIPFSVALNNLILLSNLASYSESYQAASEILYSPSFPVQILCVGIIIPITEEYIFRGIIFRRIRRNTSALYAVLISAAFFGVYHGNLVQFIYGTLCGLLLAWLYEKYGSLKAPILAHILMNVVACTLTEANAFTWMFSNVMRMAVITVACAALASTMFLMIQNIEEKPEQKEENGE